jgi:hypothetical protein
MKVAVVLGVALLVGCAKHRGPARGSAEPNADATAGAAGDGVGAGGASGRGGDAGAVGGGAGPGDAADTTLLPDAAVDPGLTPPDAGLASDGATADAALPADAGMFGSKDGATAAADAPLVVADAGPFALGDAGNEGPPVTAEFHLGLPLSTAVLTSRVPTFGWTDPGGADYFILDVCRDVTCDDIIERGFSGLTTWTLTTTLEDGPVFWRARAMLPSGRGVLTTGTAVAFVGAGTPHDTSMLAYPDFNRDGRPDVVLATERGEVSASFFGAAHAPVGAPLMLAGPALALAYAVDLNADGYGDLLVGRAGGVDVYYGGAGGLTRVSTLTGGAGFGEALAAAGDVNGDGFGDVLIGTRSGGTITAALYLSGRAGLGHPSGPPIPYPRFSPAGDVNADGYADVVACSPVDRTARLYVGSGNGLVAAGLLARPADASTFGDVCQGVGDVNGDGFGDAVVIGTATSLRASVFFGGEKGFGDAPVAIELAPAAGQAPGALYVAPAGDLNRDGFADVVVTGAGAVRVYTGSNGGINVAPSAFISGDYRLAVGLGDFDGDRAGDLLVVPRACDQPVRILAGTSGGGLTNNAIYSFPIAGGCSLLVAR